MILSAGSATAISALPSPLKSPTATDVALLPMANIGPCENVPLPLPNRTLNVALPFRLLAKARSHFVSLLKSVAATATGLRPPVPVTIGARNSAGAMRSSKVSQGSLICLGLSWAVSGRFNQEGILMNGFSRHSRHRIRPHSDMRLNQLSHKRG